MNENNQQVSQQTIEKIESQYPERSIGELKVSAIGIGAMPLAFKQEKAFDTENARKTIAAALHSGITLIDTADIYAPSWDSVGHNEIQVRDALTAFAEANPDFDLSQVKIATKGGITRSEGEKWGRDSSREHFIAAVEKSNQNLQVDCIDLYYLHRPDRSCTYAEAIETLAYLQEAGHIKHIGISNANVEEIEIALSVLGKGKLAAVQNEFSPRFNHTSWDELQFCAEEGITFVPWSPLGGATGFAGVGEKFPVIAEIAEEIGASVQQVVLAWELGLGDHVLPIPGASKPESIISSAGALAIRLSEEQQQRLNNSLLPRK